MEQHAIPQQISSYQFRLVGDMTLKQFAELAGGALVALLFYATPLPPWIKWPFIIISGLLGVALAFLPFEERPLEKWMIAFFASIYTPTIFFWEKIQKAPEFFQPETAATAPVIPTAEESALASVGQQTEAAQTAVLPKTQDITNLETSEKDLLTKIESAMTTSGTSTTSTSVTSVIPQGQQPTNLPLPQVTPPTQPPTVPANTRPGFNVVKVEPIRFVASSPPPARPKITVVEQTPQAPQVATPLQVLPTPVLVTPQPAPVVGQTAQFAPEAAPPSPPVTPNIIVGQVTDMAGKIIEGAIVEIQDSAGRPVRALKSNKLGHFMIVTPLTDGNYNLIGEKEGFTFPALAFQVKGEIIPPILVKGKTV